MRTGFFTRWRIAYPNSYRELKRIVFQATMLCNDHRVQWHFSKLLRSLFLAVTFYVHLFPNVGFLLGE